MDAHFVAILPFTIVPKPRIEISDKTNSSFANWLNAAAIIDKTKPL